MIRIIVIVTVMEIGIIRVIVPRHDVLNLDASPSPEAAAYGSVSR